MHKTLVMFVAALLCYGCSRSSITDPVEVRSSGQVSGTVINGFSEDPCILTNEKIIRVGFYYDVSAYDSIRVSFSAARLSTVRPFDEIFIRIGPATYLQDSVYATQKNVSRSLKVSDISKPNLCAFTFWTVDPSTTLRLSNLRVIGWRIE